MSSSVSPRPARSARSARTLLAEYPPSDGSFDELREADGQVRVPYTGILERLEALSPRERRQREELCRRLVTEQGITYTVYDDPRGLERPWQLDPLPFVLSAAEWRGLEEGLIQRASLLDQILADCYGPQELIRSGTIPPALVWGQPDFLRPMAGVSVPQNRYLHFYAADLARSPDGRWWVISDRTQIPTGGGYALANRMVSSRVFPEVYRQQNVQRLADFFAQMRTMLAGLASRRTEDPRVVVLTPGPYNETYYEQAYLARYLGYSLVEGQDLAVRDNRLFLKTLSGLEPVDVILRRVDDDFCDPLELRGDSMLGVPGLVEVLRAGNAVVANALGSGLVQSPAFQAFLPGIARHLLDEELKIPSVATWWCGQKEARDYALKHLERLFVKPAFSSHRAGFDFKSPLSIPERQELRRQVEFNPYAYVGQEWVRLSRAPSLHNGGLIPRKVGLRVYLVATETGYQVMPGGLTRVMADSQSNFISMQRGSISKDTWVLSDQPAPEFSLLHARNHALELRRTGNNLPSRVADNFYWIGRYAERLDTFARLLRSTFARLAQEGSSGAFPLLLPLLRTLENHELLPARTRPLRGAEDSDQLESDLHKAVYDPALPNSLAAQAHRLERLGTLVRDRTSLDLWRALSDLQLFFEKAPKPSSLLLGDSMPVLNQVIIATAALNGLAEENMTRTQAWRFLEIGRRIERGFFLCGFAEQALRTPEPDNSSRLEIVLEVADSTITYRNRYNLLPDIAAVFDLVLLDESNPRSLAFQLVRLVQHFEALPQARHGGGLSPALRILLEARNRIQLLNPRSLHDHKNGLARNDVVRALEQTRTDLPRLSNAIAADYFSHSSISRTGRGR